MSSHRSNMSRRDSQAERVVYLLEEAARLLADDSSGLGSERAEEVREHVHRALYTVDAHESAPSPVQSPMHKELETLLQRADQEIASSSHWRGRVGGGSGPGGAGGVGEDDDDEGDAAERMLSLTPHGGGADAPPTPGRRRESLEEGTTAVNRERLWRFLPHDELHMLNETVHFHVVSAAGSFLFIDSSGYLKCVPPAAKPETTAAFFGASPVARKGEFFVVCWRGWGGGGGGGGGGGKEQRKEQGRREGRKKGRKETKKTHPLPTQPPSLPPQEPSLPTAPTRSPLVAAPRSATATAARWRSRATCTSTSTTRGGTPRPRSARRRPG